MLRADDLIHNKKYKDGKWVIARPIKQSVPRRIKDAIKVLKGNAEAVSFDD